MDQNKNSISLETVIKGLECCLAEGTCEECPYTQPDEGTCESLDGLLKDALVLLKEREPVRPLIANDMYFCGSCKYAIPRTTNYCPKCGKKVEWNG